MSTPTSEAATRLCAACGMCCNGVLFHNVRLQPDDVPQELVQRGLHLKRKKSGSFFLQPCPAFRDAQCSIYTERPTRCRLFECRQLRGVLQGEIEESEALTRIDDLQRRVKSITNLLDLVGKTDAKRPLRKRYEKIMAEPPFEPEMVKLHETLTNEMTQLEEILDRDFRIST